MEKNRKDTVEAYNDLNFQVDPREYSHVSAFLHDLGIDRVRLITNNPRKVRALEDDAITVERVPVVVGINHWNIHYIETKKNKLGHLIDLDIPR